MEVLFAFIIPLAAGALVVAGILLLEHLDV